MSGRKKASGKLITTPREKEMEAIRKIARAERSEQQIERLRQLKAEENRERFCKMAKGRRAQAVKALERVAMLANPNSYSYDQDDVLWLLRGIDTAYEGLQTAFGPKENGQPVVDPAPWEQVYAAEEDAPE